MSEKIFCDGDCQRELGTPDTSPWFQVTVHPMTGTSAPFKNHLELDFCHQCIPPRLLDAGKLVDNPRSDPKGG